MLEAIPCNIIREFRLNHISAASRVLWENMEKRVIRKYCTMQNFSRKAEISQKYYHMTMIQKGLARSGLVHFIIRFICIFHLCVLVFAVVGRCF